MYERWRTSQARVRKLFAEDRGNKRTVLPEEIENNFNSAGWHLDGSFSDYLVIGYTDRISILAGKEVWENDDSDDPVFELIDHERDLTYRVQEIPTPQQAKEMLLEHGLPPGEGED
jgi:hypothetical protein